MIEKFKNWWKWDSELEKNSADNPVTALTEQQRRNAGPLLALAFGWGFLVTGLFTGGLLGNGLPFWPDIVLASFLRQSCQFYYRCICGLYWLQNGMQQWSPLPLCIWQCWGIHTSCVHLNSAHWLARNRGRCFRRNLDNCAPS